MSKFTILYKEYKDAGGELPASFANLANLFGELDFVGAFEARNLLKEIGQETMGAFYNRLDAKARALFPGVKEKLEIINAAPRGRNRTEKTTQELTGHITSTLSKGEVNQATKRFENPMDVEALNNTERVGGEQTTTNSADDTQVSQTNNGGTIVREYTEETVDTALTYAELVDRYGDLFNKTLRAFDSLFLGVW